MLRAALSVAVCAGAAAVPAAGLAATLRVPVSVDRSCSALRADGSAGVARAIHVPRRDGVVTARLSAARGDWDLAVFDGRSRRRVDASTTFGSREIVTVPSAAGRPLIAQACRRTGAASSASVSFTETPIAAAAGPTEPVQMLAVALMRAGDLDRLEATGLDVTHAHTATSADVVTYSAAERLRLARAGFRYRVRIADMVAADRRELSRARSAAAAAVPSGRTEYRAYAEYGEDLKALVAANPALVKPIEIGRSLEDRAIEGVEIATDVARTDDGRPTFVVMGLHHAREWPSGEMPIEFATDLVKRYPTDARVKALLDAVRIVVLPVINPDGFSVSRAAGTAPTDDQSFATLPQALTDSAAYKRKNCRAPDPASQGSPCVSRPAGFGVDPNRNYGAYYGGKGSSTDPTAQNYRGTGPYSEPESEAVHKLSQTRNIVLIITHHTFTDQGVWLRQPGFCFSGNCSADVDVVPDEPGMKLLGDSMAQASGWTSQLGWAIGEITGATEDWNYFATGAYGYTPEQRGNNFHPSHATAVAAEWPGVGEALLRAGEFARDRAWHSVLRGTAPPGKVLRLTKSFQTPTYLEGVVVADTLNFVLPVPASGSYVWDVNPSTRPLSTVPETYTMTCETPAGEVLETRLVGVVRGATTTTDFGCGEKVRPTGPNSKVVVDAAPRVDLVLRSKRFVARRLNRGRTVSVGLRVVGGSPASGQVRLVDSRGRTVASGRFGRAKGKFRVVLRRRAALRLGRHRLKVTGRDSAGRSFARTFTVRVR